MDCGATCLRMIARYYGKNFNIDNLRAAAGFNKEGVSLLGITEASEKIGLKATGVQLTYQQLIEKAPLPCILHWNQNHFVVLFPISKFSRKKYIKISDPSNGLINITKEEFKSKWVSSTNDANEETGTALLLEPTSTFYELSSEKEEKISLNLVLKYVKQSWWQILQVFIALLVTSLLQLAFPFLTQSVVDIGINTENIQFITIVFAAQLALLFSRSIVDFIRSRLLLTISISVSISILSDFWIKITRLPLSYFDNHHTGDIIQRISDNKQIQFFLTGPLINTFFSIFNFFIFSIAMAIYNVQLFIIFITGSVLYLIWIRLFLRIRRKINYQLFSIAAQENNSTLQLVQGMQEIRLNNAEDLKRYEWETIQVSIFNLNQRSLNYNQLQQIGTVLINQGKDILITFLVAKLVVESHLTFGSMLAIQYILGQLGGPVEQFVSIIQSGQDAKISMERLNDIHQLKDETNINESFLHTLPTDKSLHFTGFSFCYPNAINEPVLQDINLIIPEGKVTAIVGVSGSGKTTLLKLLLKFYNQYDGRIKIGPTDFKNIDPAFWRSQCGAVLQDGYIFNDTIYRNIAVSDETPDFQRLIECCKKANIYSFITSLPNEFNTKLGTEGVGISQGQKQRLLIARALYKKPHYLLLDEATNALDANNEKEILENMKEFFKNKTVVVVAHRLSTVKHADKIIVLDKGKIVEEGNHAKLTALKGKYYELVKNQLELEL